MSFVDDIMFFLENTKEIIAKHQNPIKSSVMLPDAKEDIHKSIAFSNSKNPVVRK